MGGAHFKAQAIALNVQNLNTLAFIHSMPSVLIWNLIDITMCCNSRGTLLSCQTISVLVFMLVHEQNDG